MRWWACAPPVGQADVFKSVALILVIPLIVHFLVESYGAINVLLIRLSVQLNPPTLVAVRGVMSIMKHST